MADRLHICDEVWLTSHHYSSHLHAVTTLGWLLAQQSTSLCCCPCYAPNSRLVNGPAERRGSEFTHTSEWETLLVAAAAVLDKSFLNLILVHAGKVSASQLSAAKKLAGPLVEHLLQTLHQQPSVCAQCGDISEDAVVSACHHVFCRQCITMQVRPAPVQHCTHPALTATVSQLIRHVQ